MASGTIVCAVEDETQKTRYVNTFGHTDVHTDDSEGDDNSAVHQGLSRE